MEWCMTQILKVAFHFVTWLFVIMMTLWLQSPLPQSFEMLWLNMLYRKTNNRRAIHHNWRNDWQLEHQIQSTRDEKVFECTSKCFPSRVIAITTKLSYAFKWNLMNTIARCKPQLIVQGFAKSWRTSLPQFWATRYYGDCLGHWFDHTLIKTEAISTHARTWTWATEKQNQRPTNQASPHALPLCHMSNQGLCSNQIVTGQSNPLTASRILAIWHTWRATWLCGAPNPRTACDCILIYYDRTNCCVGYLQGRCLPLLLSGRTCKGCQSHHYKYGQPGSKLGCTNEWSEHIDLRWHM